MYKETIPDIDLDIGIEGRFREKEVCTQDICVPFSEESPEWFLKDSK